MTISAQAARSDDISSEAIETAVQAAHRSGKNVSGGANADYIPSLASVPSHLFGVAAMTPDGRLFSAGDTSYGFAIESISKVFTLALAMDQLGPAEIRKKIGVSPTGLPFNSVIALELHSGKPLSPLVNAGAIATVSLIPGKTADECWAQILDAQCRFAGRKLSLSDDINRSEQGTNFHNRAIAWLLYSANTCYSDPMRAVDVYTRQCSTLVSTEDLATMGATLAAGGINPKTQQRIIKAENVPFILAEMAMEGVYTASGDWAFAVGIPAKSGVGGGLLAVAPGRIAIAAFSPPLDDAGNSVKAWHAVASVAHDLGLNLYAPSQTEATRVSA
ncbi:glutaminase A [Bradyrhizobium sp. USDA 4353]